MGKISFIKSIGASEKAVTEVLSEGNDTLAVLCKHVETGQSKLNLIFGCLSMRTGNGDNFRVTGLQVTGLIASPCIRICMDFGQLWICSS